MRVGIMFAPGASNDHSMNEYMYRQISHSNSIRKTVQRFLPLQFDTLLRTTPHQLYVEHPNLSHSSIEVSINRLINKRRCQKIFILGEQCKSTIDNFLRDDKYRFESKIYMANVPYRVKRNPDELIFDVDVYTNRSNNLNCQVYAHNYNEHELSSGLALALQKLSERYKSVFAAEPAIAVIGGADVPVINEWMNGILSGWDYSTNIHAYTLGTDYSKFNDPRSGYELTEYLIDTYDVNFVVSICGASCKGVISSIRERQDKNSPIYFIPYDFADWNDWTISSEIIPIALVRNIENLIAMSLADTPVDPLHTGTMFSRSTRLGELSQTELQEIRNHSRHLKVEYFRQ